MPDTYIVTGGAGFIGSHLVERLLNDGHHVRVIDNFSTGTPANLKHLVENPALTDRLTIHECSITDKDSIRPLFDGVRCVFHHAALPSVQVSIKDPLAVHEHCATGTLNVLVAARDAGVKRVVYAASAAAYGDVEVPSTGETMLPDPKSPYGAAKLFGEYYCKVFTEVYGLETVSLRYFNVFGPRQDPTSDYAAVIPIFISRMLDGQTPIIYGDGLQTRDFTYVENIVHGNLLAAESDTGVGSVLNIAMGASINLLGLVDKLNRLLGTSYIPVHESPQPGDIKHSRAAIERARQLISYEPIVDFDTGLARTVAWYQQMG